MHIPIAESSKNSYFHLLEDWKGQRFPLWREITIVLSLPSLDKKNTVQTNGDASLSSKTLKISLASTPGEGSDH